MAMKRLSKITKDCKNLPVSVRVFSVNPKVTFSFLHSSGGDLISLLYYLIPT